MFCDFGGDAEQDHEVVEDTHDEHPDDGARHRAGTAEDAVATDSDRGDGIELLAQAGVGTCALVDGSQQDAADGREGGNKSTKTETITRRTGTPAARAAA